MTIFAVPISGVSPDPEVYGGLVAASNTVGGDMFSPTATAWLALDANTRGRTLRAATLFLDRLAWEGTATGFVGTDPTTLQWPRSDVTVNGLPVDSTTVPADIVRAAFELAVGIAASPALVGKIDQGSNISSAGSGPDQVSFFAPSSAINGTALRFPLVVQQLIGKYLATPGGTTEGGTGSYGGCESSMSHHRQFRIVRPE